MQPNQDREPETVVLSDSDEPSPPPVAKKPRFKNTARKSTAAFDRPGPSSKLLRKSPSSDLSMAASPASDTAASSAWDLGPSTASAESGVDPATRKKLVEEATQLLDDLRYYSDQVDLCRRKLDDTLAALSKLED